MTIRIAAGLTANDYSVSATYGGSASVNSALSGKTIRGVLTYLV